MPLEIPTTVRGLGRVYVPNPGSQNYPLRAVVPRMSASRRRSKKWRMLGGGYRSQGMTSSCVRYGTTHNLMIEPIIRDGPLSFGLTDDLMGWAKANDQWDGEDYDGTSVDAGLRFHKNVAKTIREFRWAQSMDDVLNRLAASADQGGGPLVVGTDWYSGMDRDYGDGGIEYRGVNVWTPTGTLRGGHCWNAVGHLAPTAKRSGYIQTGNSHEGNFEALIEYDAFEWLIFSQNGEASAVTELPR